MNFINPLMLAGVALAAVPIILHLVMRPRPRRLEFPALRFVQRRQEANRRRLRWRHWLLLACRVGAIALLAGAMARPRIRPAGAVGEANGPVAAALIFDTAPRMQYRHENHTRLEAARDMGAWLLDRLPVESQVAVIESGTSWPVFQVDLGAAKDRVERLEISSISRPLDEAFSGAIKLLAESDRPRKEIYVFTDLAKSAWQVSSPKRLEEQLGRLGAVGIYLVDVGVDEPRNFALGRPALSSETLSKNSLLRVGVELSCLGTAGERTVELYLIDERQHREKRSQQSVHVEAGQSRLVELSVGGLDVGTHQGELRFGSGDALPADDVRYFTVEVLPPWRVLLVAPHPAEDHAFLLSEALAPDTFRKTGRSRFVCETIGYAALSSTTLGDYDVVCLLDPAPLKPRVWARLDGYVAGGGGLAVFLGRRAEPIDALNGAAAQELLPASLRRQARRPRGDVYLTPIRMEHPLWTKFRPLAGQVPWSQFPVYRYWQLGSVNEDSVVVATFSDGSAALVDRSLGQGHVLLMATPLSDLPAEGEPWNRLPSGFQPWPFVMLANEAVQYLAGGNDSTLNYVVGQTAVLGVPRDHRWSTYVLSTPDEESYRRTFDRRQNAIVISATDRPGNYRVRAGGVAEGIDRGFSINLADDATRLARLEPRELEPLFGDHDYVVVRRRDEMQRKIARGRVGRELFGPIMMLLVLLLAAEHILANRFYRHDSMAREMPPGADPQSHGGATLPESTSDTPAAVSA